MSPMTPAPGRFEDNRFIDLLRGIQEAKGEGVEQARTLFKEFRLHLERHIAREEEFLFPSFNEAKGAAGAGLTAVMRVEHRQIRHLLDEIDEKFARGDLDTDAEQIVLLELLRGHQQQERAVVYRAMEGEPMPGLPSRPPEGSRPATGRERFLDACHCRPVDHPPVWMMGQAGRCLPEFRELEKKHSLREVMRTPELAAEAALQPIERFGFDAAILFADNRLIAEALGRGACIRQPGDIRRLELEPVEERLGFVAEALRLVRQRLGDRAALLAASPSPWTLAALLLEEAPAQALELLQSEPAVFSLLLEKLTLVVTHFLRLQTDAGADAVQIFDSHGGSIPSEKFEAASGKWMRQVIAGLEGSVPAIVFSNGARNWGSLMKLGARVIGIDAGITLRRARRLVPGNIALQGNLDPELLVALTPGELGIATRTLLEQMRNRPGYIFNLGDEIPSAASPEGIARVIETVRHFHP